jgi:galactokinase
MADEPVYELFVPGRLCLFGEHSDWAGGYRSHHAEGKPLVAPGATLVVGLSHHGLHARAKRRGDALLALRSVLDHGEVLTAELRLDDAAELLRVTAEGGFWSYAAGTALALLQSGHAVGGMELDNYLTTLPVRKGLSSSAALCVLIARAFSRTYGLALSVRQEMELAYRGERSTPSACGRMDQACAFGPRPVLMLYDGDELEVEELLLGGEFHFVVADLNAAKSTTRILEALQAAFPEPSNPEQAAVVTLLGSTNLDIVRRAVLLLAAGDAPGMGRLMAEAQLAFDSAGAAVCPDQLSAPALHAMLAHPGLAPHVWGGKGVGSQGDGCVQYLCRGAAGQAAAEALLRDECGLFAIAVTLSPNAAQAAAAPPPPPGERAPSSASDLLQLAVSAGGQLPRGASWLQRTRSQQELIGSPHNDGADLLSLAAA